LTYLQPPPAPSPVVVVKDVGGWVDQYAARTEIYRETNREVRLHECRSACTMALSLPNVCVYPDSILKFHQAYDPRDHVPNVEASNQLFDTYPPAVRARLGTLTPQYKVLRGSELIALGVRDCDRPAGPRIMLASARSKPLPESTAPGGLSLASLTGKLQGMVETLAAPLGQGAPPSAEPAVKKPVPDELLRAQIPLPPARPAGSTTPEPPPPPPIPYPFGPEPLPPKRPLEMVAYTPSLPPISFMQHIDGSAEILPAKFVPFEKG
jgi:hypothetical protein